MTLGTMKSSYFLNIMFIFLNIICIDDNICQLLQFSYENPLIHLEDNHWRILIEIESHVRILVEIDDIRGFQRKRSLIYCASH